MRTSLSEERLGLLAAVAVKYHLQNKPKSDIAKEVRRSVTEVTRLLDEARDRGIVRVQLDIPDLTKLEAELVKTFPLCRAVVIPTVEDYWLNRKMLGQAAARYFDVEVGQNAQVAISGGLLLYEMVNELTERERLIHIYPAGLLGRGPALNHIDASAVATLLCEKCGSLPGRPATAHGVTVMPFERRCSSDSDPRKCADELVRHCTQLHERSALVRKTFKEMQQVDFAFVTLGPLRPAPEYMRLSSRSTLKILEEAGIPEAWLATEGAISDIGYALYDGDGTLRPEWRFFLTVDYKAVARDARRQVVLIAGMYQEPGLFPAVEHGLCNVLITDETRARFLLGQK